MRKKLGKNYNYFPIEYLSEGLEGKIWAHQSSTCKRILQHFFLTESKRYDNPRKLERFNFEVRQFASC